ncbi:hypothetical protein MN116_001764 [Schistosoma mekongi]|uniref:Uncharacterized protein n=1 Tax=Schistosoma mekongi TaxID=38744 RepID=A0AAE1ZJ26_SCHME|nr:hypothetical protein MN116_001764 [Schistosoma mekongi]
MYSTQSTVNRIENSVSHSGGGEHKVHYPPAANRVHGTEYRMASSAGYNPVPNKQSCGRDEHEDSRINSGNSRSAIKPAGHLPQGNTRVKPDLNDYF